MQDHTANHDEERLASTSRLTEASRDQEANQRLGETKHETRRLGQRHTVKETANVLGITVDAVRGRIRRGTLDSVKHDGVVYVVLDTTNRKQQSDESVTNSADAFRQTADESGLVVDQSELVGELRGQIDWLRREVERKDTIIMQMAQRIPELEAAPEPRESSQKPSEQQGGDAAVHPEDVGAEKPSWWRRFFGL
jgi:hypothetical protein